MNIQEEQNEILFAIKKVKKAIRIFKSGPEETMWMFIPIIEAHEELVEFWEEKFEQLRIMERDA